MMNVYLKPTGLHSRAMLRIAAALRAHLPTYMHEVDDVADADLQVLYVISSDAIDHGFNLLDNGKRYAVIQCCHKTAGPHRDDYLWNDFWYCATAVWSYLTLPVRHDVPYLHQPLGVDEVFHHASTAGHRYRVRPNRQPHIITTGYVSGYGCEAVAEVWEAARILNFQCTHIGPRDVEGMSRPATWCNVFDISDEQLARLYQTADYVSGLRYIEGFELPAAEGLMCGATPLLFDLPDMHKWYGRSAHYFDDNLQGEGLVAALVDRLNPRVKVNLDIASAADRFSWEYLCDRFFNAITATMENE